MHKIEIPVKSSSFPRKLNFPIFLICSVILFTQIYFSMLCYTVNIYRILIGIV